MQIGDRVSFHLILAHVCGGRDCKCTSEALETRPATVTGLRADGSADLLVDLTDADTAYGYVKQQTHMFRATTTPPESGTWTARSAAS